MNNRRCDKCGYIYDERIYGDLCPICSTDKEKCPDCHENRSVIYGPPPIEMDSFQKPQSTIYGPPPRKKFSYKLVLLIIGAILGSVIAWLFIDCSGYNQPTLYGPPPIDSTQAVSPINNE